MNDRCRYGTEKEIEKQYERTGTCNPEKCKAACCRFSSSSYTSLSQDARKYMAGMGYKIEKTDDGWRVVNLTPCIHLDLDTNRCKNYARRPWCCRHFPTPQDDVYKRVARVCSFRFPKITAKMQK